MPSAALAGLYKVTGSRERPHEVKFRHLHTGDIKRLVNVLRNYPIQSDQKTAKQYWLDVKQNINDMPYYLRSSGISVNLFNSEDKNGKVKSGRLCSSHKGLNHALVHDIWSAVRSEIRHGIGQFLYPVIMHAGLSAHQELKVRQLEPVLEMWERGYQTMYSTPEGRQPLPSTSKWRYQENECEACMLARISSDKEVLFAMLAGLVGSHGARRVGKRSNIRSRRVRWVCYALKKLDNAGTLVNEAWDLGEEMKRISRLWNEHNRRSEGSDIYGRQMHSGIITVGIDSSDIPNTPPTGYSVNITGELFPPLRPRNNAHTANATATELPQQGRSTYTETEPQLILQPQPIRLPRFSISSSSDYTTSCSPSSVTHEIFGHSASHQKPIIQSSPCPSIHSIHNPINDADSYYGPDDSELEWESSVSDIDFDLDSGISTTASEELTHNLRDHVALPTTRDETGSKWKSLPKPDRNSIYAGFAAPSPRTGGLRSMVRRGLADSDEEVDRVDSVATTWSRLYRYD